MKEFNSVHRSEMMVIGIECRTSNDTNAGPQDIPALWGRFYTEEVMGRIPNKVSSEVIALYCDYEGDHRGAYSCVIGCPVSSLDEIPEGMVGKRVPKSKCAAFHAEGVFPQSLIETWGKIWGMALDRTYAGDYEVYGENFFFQEPKKVDVFVAIQ